MIKEDCFALNEYKRCTALIKRECKGCNFYKNKEQFDKDRKEAEKMNGGILNGK